MEREINIIEMIKSRRYFKLCLNRLLPRETRIKLKERSRYIPLDPDQDNSLHRVLVKATSIERGAIAGNLEENFTDDFYSSGSEAENRAQGSKVPALTGSASLLGSNRALPSEQYQLQNSDLQYSVSQLLEDD